MPTKATKAKATKAKTKAKATKAKAIKATTKLIQKEYFTTKEYEFLVEFDALYGKAILGNISPIIPEQHNL